MTALPIHPAVSRSCVETIASLLPLQAFFTTSAWARKRGQAGVADLVTGDPHEAPMREVVDAFLHWTEPRTPDWYGYRMTDPDAASAAASVLSERYGQKFAAEDVFFTPGAAGGIACVLRTILDPGDEVIVLQPAWFFYDAMVRMAGGRPVQVALREGSFELDQAAIERALSPRTRAVIVNTPHNPSGKVFGRSSLRALGLLLDSRAAASGRAVYILSDEAYSRIVFDGREHLSPAREYARTFVIYTFTKTILTPGQRIGYVALCPDMPDREAVRAALLLAQIAGGHQFPSNPLQYAVADLERQSIDVAALQAKRDAVVGALAHSGWEVAAPEGTFYVLARWPGLSDVEVAELLAEQDVLVLPASLMGLAGYVRLSLTATERMIERALEVMRSGIAL